MSTFSDKESATVSAERGVVVGFVLRVMLISPEKDFTPMVERC